MVATAIVDKQQQCADGFAMAVQWMQEHKCADRVSVISWHDGLRCPWIMLKSLEAMKAILSGEKVQVKKTCSSTDYAATVDGIHFTVSKYGCSESSTKWEEVL